MWRYLKCIWLTVCITSAGMLMFINDALHAVTDIPRLIILSCFLFSFKSCDSDYHFPQERQTCRPQKLNPTQLRHSACSRSNPLQLVFMMKAAEYWLHYNAVVVRNVMPVDQQFGDRDVWVGNSRSKA